MRTNRLLYLLVVVSFVWAGGMPAGAAATAADRAVGQQTAELRSPDVIYVPTPPEVVARMLEVAKVTDQDLVYDLGCGDGRIVIAAARDFGATAVGIDIDPQRIKEAEANAAEAGVTGRVRFNLADLFETDLSKANVVTLYLLPSLNLKLRPKLWQELRIGSRVVSHAFDMGDWEPEQKLDVNGRTVYFWTITEDIKKRLTAGQ